MRLINTRSLHLREFVDSQQVSYAILSHRWEKDEVTLDDFRSRAIAATNKSFEKIKSCCQQAASDGFDYVWVDTCCIDKNSSAELSEAINSMYRWYQDAKICYVFFSDVDVSNVSGASMSHSAWFTRGWTLQELLAPRRVRFYDMAWNFIGDKTSLSPEICKLTGIDEAVLVGNVDIHRLSVAERMAWASGRTTTRIEDAAYSLLGIFNINMPMLYGEGERAFIRLQEEIIRTSDDESIFAWSGVEDGYPGLLAPTPRVFASCRGTKPCRDINLPALKIRTDDRPVYSLTNRGIAMTVDLLPYTVDTYLAFLACTKTIEKSPVCVLLRRLSGKDHYARVKVGGEDLIKDGCALLRSLASLRHKREGLCDSSRSWYRETSPLSSAIRTVVFVRQYIVSDEDDDYEHRANGFHLSEELLQRDQEGRQLFEVIWGSLDVIKMNLKPLPGYENAFTVGVLKVTMQGVWFSKIKLGFDERFNPVCLLAGPNESAVEDRYFARRPLNLSKDEYRQWFSERPAAPTLNDPDLLEQYKRNVFQKGDRLGGLHNDFSGVHIQRRMISGLTTWELSIHTQPPKLHPGSGAKEPISNRWSRWKLLQGRNGRGEREPAEV